MANPFTGYPLATNHQDGDVIEPEHTNDPARAANELQAQSTAEAAARAAADLLLIPLTQKAQAGGVATLDGTGKVPGSQIPALAVSEFLGDVVSQAAMLALVGQRGDWCVRTDTDPDSAWMLTTDDPTQLANWRNITTPGAVLSVNGRAGAVTGLAEQTDLTAEATARGNADTALDTAKAPKADPTGTGIATWPAFAVTGLTGAVSPARFVGGTVSGPPLTAPPGGFLLGDFAVAQDGIMWICTAAGSPGTWADASSSGHEVDSKQSVTVQTGITAVTDLTGLTGLTIPNMVKPVWVIALTAFTYPATAVVNASLTICDASNVTKSTCIVALLNTTTTGAVLTTVERIAPGSGAQSRKARMARVTGTGSITNGFDATTISSLRAIVA